VSEGNLSLGKLQDVCTGDTEVVVNDLDVCVNVPRGIYMALLFIGLFTQLLH